MRVVLSWLRDFAPFDGDPAQLGEAMSEIGLAVEAMTAVGEGVEGVVVAKVLALRPHPQADRIQIVDVDTGSGEPVQVCCGAFNMAVGDLVPLATVGTTMPNGMEIARRKMRGEWSNGMLCSAAELDLGDDAGGILVLDRSLPLGVPLAEAMGLNPDVVYELEIERNRPDALSMVGVARDLAAHLRLPFTPPDPEQAEAGGREAADLTSVEILDPDLCGRFVSRVLQGVTVGVSPRWMADRLTLAGMRPINSVVDVSNYVMLELGQPNHPYDLQRVRGHGLRVRRARPGESLVTLDGVERRFVPDDLLICDGTDAAIGIAGVMGGAATEIDESTAEVLLEMAWFQPVAVQRTSRRLGLRTEASMRFERGCDPWVIDRAMARFCELLAAASAPGAVDARGVLPHRERITVRLPRVETVLGVPFTTAQLEGYLEPIGFTVDERASDEMVVTPPSFRPDVAVEIDVIEEIARHHGYGRITPQVPRSKQAGSLTERQRSRRAVRQVLVGLGCSEAMPMPFLSPADLVRAGLPGAAVALANPLTAEESVLRPSLRPGLLKAVAHNVGHRNPAVRLFEIGHVFGPPLAGSELPDEREHLAAVLAGEDAAAAKQAWDVLASALRVDGVELRAGELAGLHPTRSAALVSDGQVIGEVGEVDPAVLAAFGIPERVGWIGVAVDGLLAAVSEPTFRAVSRFPSSDIDLAFVVPDAVPADAVEATLGAAGGELLDRLRLFDTYRGEGVPEGGRSLAFTLRFQALDRTLTDDEVAAARQRCIAAVESAHGATLRG